MTFYEPNPDVLPTGEEAAEFVEPDSTGDEENTGDTEPPDPSARPSGSPPVEPSSGSS
jgi:hypothetical protein